MGPIVGIREFIGMLSRRGPVMAALLVVCVLVALAQALALPRAFESIAVLQVQPTVLTGGVDSGDTATRLRTIEQRIMARNNVLDMIDRFNLYDDTPLSEDEKVAQFRQDVRVNFVAGVTASAGAMEEVSAIQVTAQTGTAAGSANLANDIVDQIQTGNLRERDQRLSELIGTLETQDRRALEAIAAIEADLAAFRTENTDRMPENLEFLAAEQTRLEGQRTELIRSLQALERERLALEVGTSELGRQEPLAQQLRILEVDLAQARRTLAPNHPEVQRLEAQIDALREGDGQQMSVGQSRQIDLIRQQEESLQLELAAIDRRLPMIAANVAGIPEVSETMADYTRRLAALEVPRMAIAERLSQARLDQSLVTSDYGQQMILLESATEAEYPLSSGRKRLAMLGVVLGLGLALLSGFLLEVRRPVLRTQAMVTKYLGVAPIASIPFRPTAREQVVQRTRNAASFVILIAGVVVGVILVLNR
ncbi:MULTISPECIES: hypothetical protein [Paracoccus]|uniref:hypothetical protein n=1 Tax=Paracoccus TaxID=265 RepID=UPI000A76E3BE|nr:MULTISPECIES: hypothetical protein [Paracoccus]AZY95421.1 hypothetical protein EOJ32_16640 [Paracoccus sp. Arc7-R13]TNC05880.1 hypothetical protein FHD68_02775 [Paracoccus marcusii]TYP67835.1 uncharacterized protein involved in exopolysaccharide biosynthesis [Stutzerimonas stutzeri]